ncbi:glycerol-3-phosphate 1-O-acyltransferase PlsY [Lagierella sp.]|uniref:glycerol-3-phosphate 1-O-acyltransferase PlsY n=1 Tax=Lagierella sp. TaxID=2849657 RepID=UPI002621549C|nr:glycerol-3-phosphate 1-O-acyltransferase PlsY [Lagierella sp.]
MKIILFLISYLVGSISWAVVISRVFYKKDIRDFGSGNAGTTNIYRTFGKKVAFITFLLDFLKGFLPTFIGYRLFGNEGVLLAGLGAVLGHNWPIFFGFKGGKGIATSFGVFMAFNPIYAFILVCVFFILVLLTKFVSLGSIGGAVVGVILGIINILKENQYIGILLLSLATIAIYRHRQNISRLLKGEEAKLGKK